MSIVSVRNVNKAELYEGSLAAEFKTAIGDFKEMTIGFIQAIYKDNDAFDGSFQMYVSLECELETFSAWGDPMNINPLCGAIGWRECCIAYRYFYIGYTPNSVTSGTVRIIARGKKG